MRARQSIALVTVGALMIGTLSGCTDDPRAQGAALGAGGGAIIGGVIGGRDGAAIGAGVGLIAGLLAGVFAKDQQESYVSAEDELTKRTAQARADANAFQSAEQQARRDAANQQAALRSMRNQRAQGQALNQEQRAQLASARQNESNLNALVTEGEKKVRELDEQIANLKEKGQNTAELQTQRDRINASTEQMRRTQRSITQSLQGIEA